MSPQKCLTASLALALCWVNSASAGVAVVIDRGALKLVGTSGSECPPSKVIFVTRDGRIVAVCEMPAPKPVVAQAPVSQVEQVAPPTAPTPVWRVAEKASIREAIGGWLPAGWRLAWDTTAEPMAEVAFSFEGEPMAAVADLFDRRSVWGDTPLIACAFGAEKILQVRDRGECGQP